MLREVEDLKTLKKEIEMFQEDDMQAQLNVSVEEPKYRQKLFTRLYDVCGLLIYCLFYFIYRTQVKHFGHGPEGTYRGVSVHLSITLR